MNDAELKAEILVHLPHAIESGNIQDIANLRFAGRMIWEREQLGSEEAWLFAHRYGTPIVPIDHPAHPHELVKRGWKPKDNVSPIVISRWPDGTHFYASVYGNTVQGEGGREKWNTYEAAFNAAMKPGYWWEGKHV